MLIEYGNIQSVLAYSAAEFSVHVGANMGDTLSVLDDLMLDDTYQLQQGANPQRLALLAQPNGELKIGKVTELGTPSAALHLDCVLSLMSPDGNITEALVLVEVDADGMITAIFMLPLAPMLAQVDYVLVRGEREGARKKLAQIASVSFSRGTHITMASGAQVPIEQLNTGDRVLTRDDGPQLVRWVGQSTHRATGNMAPILIRAGALNNENDLLVSPDHRLFVYQRSDEIGAGVSELLVKARHLVNGDTVVVQDGGYVEYFQVLFDRHHIIYAEGIAAESLLIDSVTKPALPPELQERLSSHLTPHGRRDDHGLEVQKALLDRPDAIAALKRASLR
ncbi:Hint domain-containing protein [Parasedimentitalea psychrophila]|uniref:Hint domain-containing protein n=1 Tax=Parasedimentitalea psychrophila TaxID=2997337 RepID=A0A9Y2KZQ9_9RHOB|nr:Hint domain-containing protein [Parasedimentitalea psychrophila]WIY25419.1 Hint domain-containing protein [Parasedimentitalea psychrophila]